MNLTTEHTDYVSRLVSNHLSDYPKYVCHRDAMDSAGNEALWRAAQEYDADHESGASFETFAWPYVTRAIKKAARREVKKSGTAWTNVSRLHLDHAAPPRASDDPVVELIQREDAAAAAEVAVRVRRAVAELPAAQREAVERSRKLLGGEKQKQIAADRGVSEAAIHKHRVKAEGSLRDSLADIAPPGTETPFTLFNRVDRIAGNRAEVRWAVAVECGDGELRPTRDLKPRKNARLVADGEPLLRDGNVAYYEPNRLHWLVNTAKKYVEVERAAVVVLTGDAARLVPSKASLAEIRALIEPRVNGDAA
jgi:RNA polymerase sigma factor (sigma-70 family)